MTRAELLAREIIRLDSRGGSDTDHQPGFDESAWPSGAAVMVALQVLGESQEVANRWEQKTWRAA